MVQPWLTLLRRGGHFIMPARTMSVFVLCTAVCLAGAHMSRGQEATSANLPDQFQTGEMIQIHKPKKKKREPSSQTVATATKQDAAPVPDRLPSAAEEVPTQVAPTEEKKIEPNRNTVSVLPSQRAATPTEQPPSAEEPAVIAVPAERKLHRENGRDPLCKLMRQAFRRPFRCRFR
jgi:hypothetical protein